MVGRARPRIALLAVLLAAMCGCSLLSVFGEAAPALAAAGLQGNSLGEQASATPETETQTTKTTAATKTSESNDTSRTLILGALGAAVLLLSGIGYVIVRDARRVAPAGEADIVEGRSARDTAGQLRRRRAKARAARQARKRNR